MNENRHSLIVPILCILLVILFMIPITGMLIDPSDPDPLNTPIYELDNQSLNDVFNITGTTTFENLNDLSISNIFYDNNLIDIDNLLPTHGTYVNNKWLYTNNTGITIYPILYINSDIGSGNLFININITNNGDTIISQSRLRYNVNTVLYTGPFETLNNNIYVSTENVILFEFAGSVADTKILNTDIDNVLIVNLTDLGIGSLTYNEITSLYNYYVDTTYNYLMYETLYDLDLTESQWNYYHDLYIYYNSL